MRLPRMLLVMLLGIGVLMLASARGQSATGQRVVQQDAATARETIGACCAVSSLEYDDFAARMATMDERLQRVLGEMYVVDGRDRDVKIAAAVAEVAVQTMAMRQHLMRVPMRCCVQAGARVRVTSAGATAATVPCPMVSQTAKSGAFEKQAASNGRAQRP